VIETYRPTNIELRESRWRAVIWIVTLQVLDVVTTYVAIKWCGAEEGNPATKWLVESYAIVVAKLVVCFGIIRFAIKAPPSVMTLALSWVVVGMYLMVIIFNTMNIIRAAV
jgi:hypothetical protein